MMSRWCSSFHDCAKCTLRYSDLRHQPSVSKRCRQEVKAKYGTRATVSST